MKTAILLAFGFAATCAVLIAILVIGVDRQGKRLDRIERQLCAFVFFEDGSATARTDDDDRFQCMEGN